MMQLNRTMERVVAAINRRTPAIVRDRRGATLIEFAFIAAPLFGLIMAIAQTSLTFFAQQNLETTAEKSVRQLMTGSAQKAGTTQSQFKTAACATLPAFMKCANLMIDVQVATSFSGVSNAPPVITYNSSGQPNNTLLYKPGGPGEITIVKFMYIWDVQQGPLGFDLSTLSAGKRLLIATSVFKTEPYSA